MSFFPKVDLRRTMLIARRDYLGYVKTWGFWLSFVTPILFGGIVIWARQSDFEFSPPRYETILDETGIHGKAIEARLDEQVAILDRRTVIAFGQVLPDDESRETLENIYDAEGREAALAYLDTRFPNASANIKPTPRDVIFVAPPAPTLEELTPWLTEEKMLTVDGTDVPLSGVVHITQGPDGAPKVAYWTPKFTNTKADDLARDYFRDLARDEYLQSGGLSAEALDQARDAAPSVEIFDPTKLNDSEGSQEVTMSDRVPYLAAAGLALLLWLNIFAGSYMLLTSMLEEKLNKLLEMMLASTRFSEIIFGKLIGVAALTLTAMAPYLILGIVGVVGYIFFGPDQDVVNGLVAAFSAKMIIFLIVFFILGYVLYGAFFIALGALSSSMQDAQTLTTPIMLVMMAALIVVPVGLESPDSPIVTIATFIPFSAPFAAIIRLPSDPPLWQLLLSTAWLALWCAIVIGFASRIFRFGLLSGAGVEVVTNWFKRKVLRRKA